MYLAYFVVAMSASKVQLTRHQVRFAEECAMADGMSGSRLMENAGRVCVTLLQDDDIKSAIVLAGTGNNGGDGFVIARQLAIGGIPTKVVLCGPADRITGDALVNYKTAVNLDLNLKQLDPSCSDAHLDHMLRAIGEHQVDYIIDALLGTGALGNPRPPMDRVIRAANRIECRKMAVDVPSGLDCDTGQPADPTFRADWTCTFVASKVGFSEEVARPFLGRVRVAKIGIKPSILEQAQKHQPYG